MGRVQIHAGSLKGRWLTVPDQGVRPTLGRVRETFFSWLRPHLPGGHCLDLFAGSGVLGFEALSEGAEHVVFVDQQASCLQTIEQHARDFGVLDRMTLVHATVPFLDAIADLQFDCVFLDPPYDQAGALLAQSAAWLHAHQALAPSARIVGEWGLGEPPSVPDCWQCLRLKQTRHLHYAYWNYHL